MSSLYNALAKWIGIANEEDIRTVTLKESMTLPPAWYAHNKICGDVGMLPLDVKKRKGDGAVNDEYHDGYRLLREQPNDFQPPSVFKEQIMSHAIMYGNGRAAIIRTGDRIQELIPILPDRTMTIVTGGVKYHITKPLKEDNQDLTDGMTKDKDGYIVLRDSEVLHIQGFSYNGVDGCGLLHIGQPTFQNGLNAQKHLNQQLKGGFRGKLFLQAPPGAFRDEGKAREFIEAFNKAEAGPDNAGKAGLLREGVMANAINMSNNDAQFVELQKFTRQDVGLLFGIEAMPGDSESVSYNSLEQKNIAYMVALDRWLVKWEEQCDMKLRTGTQKRLGSHYFKFNRSAILRTDTDTTKNVLTAYVQSKIMNRNEARAKLDLNPVEGGDVFENPAITTNDNSQTDPPDPADTEDDSNDSMNARAVEETIRSMLSREANNAINGTNAVNFCDWIDRNYAKWEPKLADKLEAIGLDRDLARMHCEESKTQLLRVAEQSTQETLADNVRACVADWKNRTFNLIGVES